jgi:cobalt-zinc-cadmium efflux system membrane fusion protein
VVKTAKERDGYWQILDGVQAGELVATEGALFLSNALAIASH